MHKLCAWYTDLSGEKHRIFCGAAFADALISMQNADIIIPFSPVLVNRLYSLVMEITYMAITYKIFKSFLIYKPERVHIKKMCVYVYGNTLLVLMLFYFCVEPMPRSAVDIAADIIGLETPGVLKAGVHLLCHHRRDELCLYIRNRHRGGYR